MGLPSTSDRNRTDDDVLFLLGLLAAFGEEVDEVLEQLAARHRHVRFHLLDRVALGMDHAVFEIYEEVEVLDRCTDETQERQGRQRDTELVVEFRFAARGELVDELPRELPDLRLQREHLLGAEDRVEQLAPLLVVLAVDLERNQRVVVAEAAALAAVAEDRRMTVDLDDVVVAVEIPHPVGLLGADGACLLAVERLGARHRLDLLRQGRKPWIELRRLVHQSSFSGAVRGGLSL